MTGRFFLPFFLLFFFACNEAKKPEKKEVTSLPPQYYYFPRANVYFDSANKDYLYLAGDSANWQTAKQIPAVVQGLMDKSILIEHPSQPVWKDNEKHRLVYSALLYATPNDTVEKKAPVTPRLNDSVNASADSSNKLPKKRSGIRRFFDKVFGGLKKKKKDTAQ